MTGTAVVTVVHGRHDHLELQRLSLALSTRAPDEHVVVAVDDPVVAAADWCAAELPTHPLGLPIAAARNRGAEVAIERGADVLVFLDVDCLAAPGLVTAYGEVVRDEPTIVWSGPVTYLEEPPPGGYDLSRLAALDSPHPARPAPGPGVRTRGADPDLFWSLSFACSVEAWHGLGGFCEDYVGYGGEDTDFARTIAASDLDLGWVGDARAYHQWHPVSRPPVEHVDDIVRNAAIFQRRWGTTPMLGWLEAFEERGLVSRDDAGRWLAVG
ncbi:galactosyltransferase-related protein [Nocardioides KLBMP 9356]|uniref:Galactosyltransferase-related protein n=1 Tax=Nocardioides potassii TaxID=2911371 RepID=A0ABS9HBA7_9ACTN|nr:galactosyltransferase-related protein [Nocardioides potassii]MCF6377406.1 galactosyltransferase-related protein [Nocardioides potassii]